MCKASSEIPADKLELYEKLVATNPRVELKGVAMPYTSLNGHMFSFLTKTGMLAIRLSAEHRDAFIKKFKSKFCKQHGTILKEYVEVPDSLLKKTTELKAYFDLSYEYVASMKPKPTNKKLTKKK